VHLSIEVQEREVEQLKVELLHAREQLEYLRHHQDIEMRESLEQALRNNRLLEATVGDLRDELKSAKDALVTQGQASTHRCVYELSAALKFCCLLLLVCWSAGKLAEENLIRENEALHQQLRAAWVSHQTLKQVGFTLCVLLHFSCHFRASWCGACLWRVVIGSDVWPILRRCGTRDYMQICMCICICIYIYIYTYICIYIYVYYLYIYIHTHIHMYMISGTLRRLEYVSIFA